jgi:outer membrane usher protein
MQGAIVLHEDGITFGMPLSETGVLVKAPGASGVGVSNQTGIKTDWRGYAIVPYATPYHKNPVLLNTTTLPDNVELALSTQTVIPTRGALARANFEANIGQRVLMTLLRPGVQQVPFGATVSDESKIHNPRGFMVGEGSQVYLTGLSDTGTLHAKWGEGAGQHCFVRYTLTHQKIDSSGIKIVHAKCV